MLMLVLDDTHRYTKAEHAVSAEKKDNIMSAVLYCAVVALDCVPVLYLLSGQRRLGARVTHARDAAEQECIHNKRNRRNSWNGNHPAQTLTCMKICLAE